MTDSPKNAEIREKLNRVATFLDRCSGNALLLSRHENIAWITDGQVEARVAAGSETAVCSLLLTRDGRRYCVAPNNEAMRLAEEEFAGLEYEAAIYPWHETPESVLRELTGGAILYSDTPAVEGRTVNLTELRAPLLSGEMARLRTLSQDAATATVEVLEGLAPGVSEQEMAARTASALMARSITPTVLLMGADERIYRYKHAVPRGGVLQRYGMVNLCARRWGLVVSITRFVHFGPPPEQLVASFGHAAHIHSALLHATRTGVTSSELFAVARQSYVDLGAAKEIEQHHQGGPCGYTERDWVITPSGAERVILPQCFAYNPSLHGAKVEDTVLLDGNRVEILTETPQLPVMETVIDGTAYKSAGILVRR